MFVISCNALFLSPEVIEEENFAFKITFFSSRAPSTIQLFLYLSNLASVKTFFLFSTVTNSNIQSEITKDE
jgi:hypothetical protein